MRLLMALTWVSLVSLVCSFPSYLPGAKANGPSSGDSLPEAYASMQRLRLSGGGSHVSDQSFQIGSTLFQLVEGEIYSVSSGAGEALGALFLGKGRMSV